MCAALRSGEGKQYGQSRVNDYSEMAAVDSWVAQAGGTQKAQVAGETSL